MVGPMDLQFLSFLSTEQPKIPFSSQKSLILLPSSPFSTLPNKESIVVWQIIF